MSGERLRLGEIGEDLAVQELERRGYAVLARRYRRRSGEIDIVAVDGRTLVFVEVKARDGLRAAARYGPAAEAVTALKRRRIVATARDFLVRHDCSARPCRFDVVAVHIGQEGPEVEVFQNAFDASG
jgi:putative endonuclease